jgi:uncharacterized membrane protein YeaQ/YmgE (transglycosylase-associated protein family)
MNQTVHQIPNPFRRGLLGASAALIAMLCMADSQALAGNAAELGQKTKQAVQDAGRSVADEAGKLAERINEARLKHRTRDEVVAWIIMGVLVAGVAGMMTSLRSTGLGTLGRLALGLIGALLGGMLVRTVNLDFAWGSATIRYEELLASLLGAIVLVLVARLLRSGATRKTSKP